MAAPRTPLVLAFLALSALAGAPEPAFDEVREGLLSPGRGAREEAAATARRIARTDPAGVAELWDKLDLRGRCLLVRALGAAGTSHAAQVALSRAALAPEEDLFRALLDGLVAGGEASLFAPVPDGMPAARREALEDLRFRYRFEAELVRLKSPSGLTGSYTGQYAEMKKLGPKVIPLLFDITIDRARPLPGESASGPYQSIHPGMVAFGPQELRTMAAYAFGEVVDKNDLDTIGALKLLYDRYVPDGRRRMAGGDADRFEREDLAPYLAFSLYDLGWKDRAETYISNLERTVRFDRVDPQILWDLGYACIRVGRYDDGEFWYQQVLHGSMNKAIAAYNLACNFSMRAAREPRLRERFKAEALYYLERAIREFNYGDWIWMEEDGDLSFIRKEPKYQELLRYLQQRYPERRKGTVPKGRSALGPK